MIWPTAARANNGLERAAARSGLLGQLGQPLLEQVPHRRHAWDRTQSAGADQPQLHRGRCGQTERELDQIAIELAQRPGKHRDAESACSHGLPNKRRAMPSACAMLGNRDDPSRHSHGRSHLASHSPAPPMWSAMGLGYSLTSQVALMIERVALS